MKPGRGKAKGNSWERKVATSLSKWFYNDPNCLIRNLNSGAMATIRKGNVPGGDIVQVKFEERNFPFSVECKHFRGFNIEDILFKRAPSKSYKAWQQCLNDATKGDKFPMLVGKDNYKDAYAIFSVQQRGYVTASCPKHCENNEVIICLFEDLTKYGVFQDGVSTDL